MAQRVYEFGPFREDAAERRLSRNGTQTALTDKTVNGGMGINCFRRSSLLVALAHALGCAHARDEPKLPLLAEPPGARPTPAQRTERATAYERTAEAAREEEPAPHAPPLEERGVLETGHAFQKPLPPRELDRGSHAVMLSNLSPGACSAELRRRSLMVERESGPSAGIAAPVRITGAMHGVRFLTPSRKSVYGKLDCRLALALDELARVLERFGVAAVRVDNFYRPRARLAGTRTRSQHRYGLAVDITAFVLASGIELSVEHDWQGAVGSAPCGPESRLSDATERALTLRDIVCDVARSGLFHHMLTPSFNAAHRDHLHLDIKRGAKRWLIE